VLISNYFEYYRLVDYLVKRLQKVETGWLWVFMLTKRFDEKTYENIRGGILNASLQCFGLQHQNFIFTHYRKDNTLFTLRISKLSLPDKLKNPVPLSDG